MKKLILFLFLLFMYTSCKVATSNTDMAKMSPKVDAIISDDFSIDSTVVDSVNGKPIQLVFLANGDQMIFSDAYKSISDLDVKLNYMTYRKVKSYETLKDSLIKINPNTKSSIVDLICFNHFLNKQGLQVVSIIEYNSLVQQVEDENSNSTLVILLYFLVGMVLLVFVIFVLSMTFAAKTVTDAVNTHNVFISKEVDTC